MKKGIFGTVLLSASLTIFSSLSAQDGNSVVKIGVTSAATLVATGKPPHQPERVLEVGSDLIENERITTSDTGRVHLLFKDGSTLTVGPNSNLVLDTYLYDPRAKRGKIAFTAAKGVFRFIGGRISKSRRVEFKTPVATLGIRGGISQFAIAPSGNSVTTAHIFGDQTTISTNGGPGGPKVTTFARQEFQASIDATGNVVFSRLTGEQFRSINRLFEAPSGVQAVGVPAAGNRSPSAATVIPALSQSSGSAFAAKPGGALLQEVRLLQPPRIHIINVISNANISRCTDRAGKAC